MTPVNRSLAARTTPIDTPAAIEASGAAVMPNAMPTVKAVERRTPTGGASSRRPTAEQPSATSEKTATVMPTAATTLSWLPMSPNSTMPNVTISPGSSRAIAPATGPTTNEGVNPATA
jgi:hypothetical protein